MPVQVLKWEQVYYDFHFLQKKWGIFFHSRAFSKAWNCCGTSTTDKYKSVFWTGSLMRREYIALSLQLTCQHTSIISIKDYPLSYSKHQDRLSLTCWELRASFRSCICFSEGLTEQRKDINWSYLLDTDCLQLFVNSFEHRDSEYQYVFEFNVEGEVVFTSLSRNRASSSAHECNPWNLTRSPEYLKCKV